MLRTCHRIIIATFVGAAAIAAQLAATGPAEAAVPMITIAATTKLPPVTGDVMVVYHDGAYSTAKIHGTITGAAAGDVATLYAKQFPYNKPGVPAGSITLKSAKATYSFTVTPALATRYTVTLATGPSAAPVATSPTQNLYMLIQGAVTSSGKCARQVCHETLKLYSILPSSALPIEISKPIKPYFGLTLGSTKTPPPPKWLYLNAGHASVTKAHRMSAGEFENTLTFSFSIGKHTYNWNWIACTRDTVSKDGLGLPGYHGCGENRVSANVMYLG